MIRIIGLLALILPVFARAETACKVAVDIGHHRNSPGATSARGKPEWGFNAALATDVAEALRRQGVEALLMNPAGDPIELRQRPADAQAAHADLLLSIHHDSVQNQYLPEADRFSGYGLFVSGKNPAFERSRAAAEAVGDRLLGIGLAPSLHHAEPIPGENRPLLDEKRGIYRYDDLVVLKYAAMPALLIEAGVIVNRHDEEILAGEDFRRRFATAVAQGVAAWCHR